MKKEYIEENKTMCGSTIFWGNVSVEITRYNVITTIKVSNNKNIFCQIDPLNVPKVVSLYKFSSSHERCKSLTGTSFNKILLKNQKATYELIDNVPITSKLWFQFIDRVYQKNHLKNTNLMDWNYQINNIIYSLKWIFFLTWNPKL